VKQNSAAAASSRRAEKSQPFCESSIRLSFASQAHCKLYAPYVRVNAVVETVIAGDRLIPNRPKTNLRQHRLVKLVPIVEIVQVHRVFWRRSVIRNFACAQNPLTRFVVVIVSAHRSVVLLDGVPI
jgi:hypothetical protein